MDSSHQKNSADNRYVYHQQINSGSNPEQHYSELNFHGGATDSNKIHNDTAPTTSVFSLSNDNVKLKQFYPYIPYCWAEIPAIQDLVSITQMELILMAHISIVDSDRFDWIMIKSMSLSNSDWQIFDNKRNTVNPTNIHLANQNHADGSDNYEVVDFLSNGLKSQDLVVQVLTIIRVILKLYTWFAETQVEHHLIHLQISR